MSERDWKILLADILEAIEKIEKYTVDVDFNSFIKKSMMTDAVVRNIEIIGEASKNIPDSIKQHSTKIPWKQMSGIRNRIVHDYFGVDLKIIWHIVRNELPSLKSTLIQILES